MKKDFYILLSIGLLNLVLFFGIFKLLQNEAVYSRTLGKISQNYERVGEWNNYTIQKVSKPYTKWTDENLTNWDASIYKCISERWYKIEDTCYGKVRGAFFPLFPFLWKYTNSTASAISLINYLIFIISISLLVVHLLNCSSRNKWIIFTVLITLPCTVIYYIPYTEALFLLTMTIATIGLLKNRYWFYFTGFLLLAMVRPATIFVLLAILTVEFLDLFRNGQFKLFLKSSFSKSIPFLIGYSVSFLIQTVSSGTATAMIDAQKYWAGELQSITGISDWSVEGFGLSSFAIFFVSVPAVCFLIHLIINIRNKSGFLMNTERFTPRAYLFYISISYLAGIFFFTLLTSGGNIHSYFRFTIVSPLFYIALLIVLNHIRHLRIRNVILVYIVMCVSIFLFLFFAEYGGTRIQFSFVGMYLLMAAFLYLMIRNWLNKNIDIIALSLLTFCSLIWNTYLFNMFLSDGWIFT